MVMSSGAANEIGYLLESILRDVGFTRHGLSWYRYERDSILAVDIQPAKYSPWPYINLGVYYFKYGKLERPDISDCQVTTRLTSIVPNPLREMELLDVTNDLPWSTRKTELQDTLVHYGILWLHRLAKFAEAKILLSDKTMSGYIAPLARAELMSRDRREK